MSRFLRTPNAQITWKTKDTEPIGIDELTKRPIWLYHEHTAQVILEETFRVAKLLENLPITDEIQLDVVGRFYEPPHKPSSLRWGKTVHLKYEWVPGEIVDIEGYLYPRPTTAHRRTYLRFGDGLRFVTRGHDTKDGN
jgi:hypothetical protein